jgi:sugar O-acyltransferase (sialic acid O-acetyltransferase NeuD family)
MKHHPLVIFGFGGHARSVADVALATGYSKLVFVDSNARDGELFIDFPVQKIPPKEINYCFCAAGDNNHRKDQIKRAIDNNWVIETIISSHATLGVDSFISKGTIIAHHAHIGPMAEIGVGCIINTGAIVEHECCVGDFSHISINVTLAGRVKVGHHVFIGAGSVVRDKITIGDNIIIGAGSTVIHDLLEPGTYLGSPAVRHNRIER